VDMIHPDWQEKLNAVRTTAARRANRRIVFRQVGDRLIPIGITSGRDPAAATGTEAEHATRRSRRERAGRGEWGMSGPEYVPRSPDSRRTPTETCSRSLEELMIMEAMRLSMLDEEERERKARADRERQAAQQQRNGEVSLASATRTAPCPTAAAEAAGAASSSLPRPSTSSEDKQRRRLSGAFRDFFSHTSSHGPSAAPSGSATPTMARREGPPPLPSPNPDDSPEPSLPLPPPLVPQHTSETGEMGGIPSVHGATATPPAAAVPAAGSSSPWRPSPLSKPPMFATTSYESTAGDSASVMTRETEPSYVGLPSDDDLTSTAGEPSETADKGKGRQGVDSDSGGGRDGSGGGRIGEHSS
jgi:hypothetical protein